MDKATTVDKQIEFYKERGCELDDEEEARQVLLDIGYYRLGFYAFPFEKTYPSKENRTHDYKAGTKFSEFVALYKFDFALRMVMLKYINHIETNFRTKLVYVVSNHYKDKPTWFADPKIMTCEYVNNFDKKIYDQIVGYEVIKLHHKKHINDKYAPAWKTFNCVNFGNLVITYQSLLDRNVKIEIAKKYKIYSEKILLNYIRAVKDVRNVVAHNGVLFDHKLERSTIKGAVSDINDKNKNRLYSVILVMEYLMKSVPKEFSEDMKKDISIVFDTLNDNKKLKNIIKESTGYF